MITKQLVKNHTATVEMRSQTKVTEFQKNDAKVALVKKLKEMFTGEFKKYNSPSSAADGSVDPAFCAALAELFAKLPGYEEVWGELCVGYKDELQLQQSVRQLTGSLSVPDDTIREHMRQVAQSITMQVGFLLADGNTSEMTDLGQHDRLVDELVNLVKRFVREHREYDSYIGLRNLTDNEEFKLEMADVIGNVMGTEGGMFQYKRSSC